MGAGNILVVGSANLDLVFQSERIPRPGETILGKSFTTHPGGKGANQAVAIGRLGGDVTFLGCLGDDDFGDSLWKSLTKANVKTSWLDRNSTVPTGTACIVVDGEGMNSIVVAPGANGCVTLDRVQEAIAQLDPTVTLCQLEVPLDAVEAAAQAPNFILNPAPACPLPPAILARCEILTPNETETELLTGINPSTETACLQAGHLLLEKGVKNVVITRGHLGCYWVSPEGGRIIGTPPVKAIDTTAAGDAFNGALALFLAEGRDLGNAIALANCVGALSTTKAGAQESMPTLDELKQIAGQLY